MSHAQKISPEVKARAVRMVQEHQEEYPSVTAEIKALKAKVRRLEGDNAILKAATTFFVGELDSRTR
jgi:transposase-like protein